MARPIPRLAPVTRAVTSYTHRVLQGEAEPGLGGNFDPLALGENLHGASGASAAGGADGRSPAPAEDAAQDRARGCRATDHFGALGASGAAGAGHFLRGEVDHPAVHAHGYQVQGELGAAADLARLLVLDQLGYDIGAARHDRLAF